ncbi:MAG: manganese efflux pump MntP family protein [Firmicutes bacterium]|nr:manganese efflux pump MntP family protein [Bacillota bacterium]
MGLFEIFMIGVGLSMDAFAASICKGLNMRRLNIKNMLIIGLFFGGFQALMPAVGWLLGKQFESYITSVDHWVAFALLVFIGGKMIYDVFTEKNEDECGEKTNRLDMKEVLTLAVATSIDALAVGISFAFLQVDILKAVSVIGVTTFVLSVIGVAVGNVFGSKYEKKATLAGGIILILIGLKILLEHTGMLG